DGFALQLVERYQLVWRRYAPERMIIIRFEAPLRSTPERDQLGSEWTSYAKPARDSSGADGLAGMQVAARPCRRRKGNAIVCPGQSRRKTGVCPSRVVRAQAVSRGLQTPIGASAQRSTGDAG